MDRAASTKRDVLESMLLDESVEPTDLPLSLLENITNGFSDDKRIGRGGFAVVYKGMLRNGTIAVKKLSNTHLHENKFHQEVECLMKANHKNVVRFLGYCADTQGRMEIYNGRHVMADVQQRLLCFEYLPKGSLHDYITDASRELEWTQWYQIIKGICAGLHYLHESCIVHSDLKPTNILFDNNLVPKIADFGLSRCFDERQSHVITSNIYGTLGYIAPEVVHCRRISFKSDMYSLGVIIIDILTGEKMYPEDHDVLKSWGNRLDKIHREKQLEQLRVCAEIGKECTDYDPRRRPDARDIVRRLDEADIVDGYVVTDMSNLSRAQKIHKIEEHGDGLFGAIGGKLSLKCLLRVSRSDYGTVASLSRHFRTLVRNGDIYRLRRQTGVAEHWIYVSCKWGEWTAYDLERRRWNRAPNMPLEAKFMWSDGQQSLVVGTDLLVFGRWGFLLIYSILTNSWIQTTDAANFFPCCLFGSTSVGQKAYLAGGATDHNYDAVLSTAVVMYDSEEKVWEPLPSMNRARKLCSAAFMDGKLYVIGGVGSNRKVLTCGEEYDFERRSWRVIDYMAEGFMINTKWPAPPIPPPAVVNNELYAAYRTYTENNVKKYDKRYNRWITLGKLPEGSHSNRVQNIGFKACGDKLIFAVGNEWALYPFGAVKLYSWVPNEQPPVWNLIARHPSGTAVFNFAVMSC